MTETSHACCTPESRSPRPDQVHEGQAAGTDGAAEVHQVEQRQVPAGTFRMGDHHGDGSPRDGERPVHEVDVPAFSIDATTVTNADFAAFVDASGYATEAERLGFSAVFHLVVACDDDDRLGHGSRTPWWISVRGADWRHPEGRRSTIEGRLDHPVVHVSWHDAQAYCGWARRRLPTEAEWERASRGGEDGLRFPWGNRPRTPGGRWRLNIWQGQFPEHNTEADGWLTTAPVRTFEPNGFGLWQTVGNVWEWCDDVFDPRAYERAAAGRAAGRGGPLDAPFEAPRVLRGGSYLCHDSYCNRYRNAARTGNTPDSSMGNAGFRTVAA